MTDHPPAGGAVAEGRPHGGRLNAAISNRVVQIQRDYTGRGPTKARTFVNGDVVIVLLQDGLTKAERSLAADGKGDTVIAMRHEFQRTMRAPLAAAIEELTGRCVVAFLSDNHVEPDVGIEVFLLDGDVSGDGHRAAVERDPPAPRPTPADA